VSHVHLTAEFVLFFTGAAHPGVAGEEKRIKDWHGDHEFSTGTHLLSLFYIPIYMQELGNHIVAATITFLVSGSCFISVIFFEILNEIFLVNMDNFQFLISLLLNRRKADKGEHGSTRKQMGTSIK
jgi:hypothetical protein